MSEKKITKELIEKLEQLTVIEAKELIEKLEQLTVIEAVAFGTLTGHFFKSTECDLYVDFNKQVCTIKKPNIKTLVVPFHNVKHFVIAD